MEFMVRFKSHSEGIFNAKSLKAQIVPETFVFLPAYPLRSYIEIFRRDNEPCPFS